MITKLNKTLWVSMLPLAMLAIGCTGIKSTTKLLSGPDTFVAKNGEIGEYQMLNWQHLDLLKDTIPGMSVDRAYKELIRKKKGNPVTVAVLDAGIDLLHEDLASVLWINAKEIAGNGQDNDGNGFIDDIHGYNFLGNSYHERLEFTRILSLGLGDEKLREKARKKIRGRS
ncbi:hypothetical protein [Cecembia calidifontis]|uniref:hypothetical protein n=1 Tax=Cecembia calidifontis TaxID=1187080 RepID=UPI001A923409|nr:hypothetical protein [Cecembia calidifontis]